MHIVIFEASEKVLEKAQSANAIRKDSWRVLLSVLLTYPRLTLSSVTQRHSASSIVTLDDLVWYWYIIRLVTDP
jgi:hypothetical protein